MRPSRLLPCLALALVAGAAPLAGQAPRTCPVVPDSVAGPTDAQIRERDALRDTLLALGRAHGVAAPAGLLYVDVDSTRRGVLRVLDSNLPDPAVLAMTRRVETYLEGLPQGRGYRALVRIDGEYPVVRAGRRNCPPALINYDRLQEILEVMEERHPRATGRRFPQVRRAALWVVVNRDGGASYVQVETPTGDAFYDPLLPTIPAELRFLPAELDGVPYDARFRIFLPLRVP